MRWEVIHDEESERVRRMPVPGGWLYQVETWLWHHPGRDGEPVTYTSGWSPPVFVPTAQEGS